MTLPLTIGPFYESAWIELRYDSGNDFSLFYHPATAFPLTILSDSTQLFKLPAGEKAEFDADRTGPDFSVTMKIVKYATSVGVQGPIPPRGHCFSIDCPDGVDNCEPGQVPNSDCNGCVARTDDD